MNSANCLPLVSIIIPVYNDPVGIRNCLTDLTDQTYNISKLEIIVVDNGSTDETRSVAREFDVQLLIEDEIQGSYAARNKGIEQASGEVLAFVDADCTPDQKWIESGVQMIVQQNVDLVAGRVRFDFSPDRTAAERYDAMAHMRNDKKVRRGIAMTANLFARKTVIEKIGKFPQHLPSGGDVYWTRSATDAGMKLVYSPDAIVDHPARQRRSLLKKMYRVGNGSIEMWYLDDQTTAWTVLKGVLRFPLKALRFMRPEAGDETEPEFETPPDRDVEQTVGVYIIAVLAVVALIVGRIIGIVKLLRRLLTS